MFETVSDRLPIILQYNHAHGEHGYFARTGFSGVPRVRAAKRLSIREIADRYQRTHGLPEHAQANVPINEARMRRVADAHDRAVHNPADPAVARSYRALLSQTLDQYHHLRAHGVTLEPFHGKGEPYADSKAMLADLNTGHLFYLQTAKAGDLPADHPLMKTLHTVDGPKTANDVFRAVHDAFGHGIHGWSFGPRGEENAWLTHSRMFTPDAHMALAAETRAQNNWFNYGKHLRRADGSIPVKGEADYVPMSKRPFAKKQGRQPPKVGMAPLRLGVLMFEEIADRLPVLQFNPNHGEHGRFSSGGSSSTNFKQVVVPHPGGVHDVHPAWHGFPLPVQHGLERGYLDIKRKDGGGSLDIKTGGSPHMGSPGDGYMVAHRLQKQGKSSERVMSANTLGRHDIARYVTHNREHLMRPGMHFGSWHDPKDGKAYLDVSEHVRSRDAARALQIKHGQKAVFNLHTIQSESLL